ncbi:MAG: PKD domain-containing protein [Bacteroidia bacterium]|nr:PKD domain-containing protein [Bacteroidia bacterium]
MTRNATLLFLCFIFGFTSLYSQKNDLPKVFFKSGTVVFTENLEKFITQPGNSPVINGYYYRYIQFYEIPGNEAQKRIQNSGIRLYDYLPHNTWLAAIPVNINRTLLRNFGIRSIVPPSPAEKIDPRLVNESLPYWAVRGDRIELHLRFYPGVSATQAETALRPFNAAILKQVEEEPAFFIVQLPIDQIYNLAALPLVGFIEPTDPPGEPEDDGARSLHRAGIIDSDYSAGRHYNGEGINILVRDDGEIGPHIDFHGRLTQVNAAAPLAGTHGDMVAGVFSGAGNLNPTTRGAATGAHIYVIDYQASFTDNTLALHQNDSVMITNSSYSDGCNTGYTTTTQRVDKHIYDNPLLLHMFSAGNNNNNECGYGAGSQWGNITGGHKQGKNVMAVANLYADAALENSSSRGPAYDGRIKPDIAAHGQGQISTDPNNGYSPGGGTSAASPSTAGVVAQLYQVYRELNNNAYPESPLIKACLLNTANDIGNPGPDFQYGWGIVNGLRAAKTLEENRYFSQTISQGDSNIHTLTIPAGTKEARVMVYWLDKESTPSVAIALVNNLNMTLTDPGNTTHLPLVLNHAPNATALNLPATPGIDNLNNMEQVRLTDPAAGTYTLKVKGTAVPVGPQKYYVVYEFIPDEITVVYPSGGEGFVPGETQRIHWDAYGNSGTFAISYSTNGGTVWTNIAGNILGNSRMYSWTVPATVTGQAIVRVNRGTVSGQSEYNFSIADVPQNIQVSAACPDSFFITWSPVSGATGYDVFLLGDKYMDSVASTTTNSIVLSGNFVEAENWLSVRATGPQGLRSRRANAVQYTHPTPCPKNDDLALLNFANPAFPVLSQCFGDTLYISLNIQNAGTNPQTGFTLSYQLGNNAVVTETFSGTLLPGAITQYTFAQPEVLGINSTYTIAAWLTLNGDQNTGNNQTDISVFTAPSALLAVPFTENFESQLNCGTDADCGNTICTLSNNWINVTNGFGDEIDWRVDNGGTPSNGTGPTADHNPGTAAGKYLYTEASGSCDQNTAQLISPCIDLTGVPNPVLRFWYHMLGADMGELHVDIFDGNNLYTDVITPLAGDQGNSWKEGQISLASYGALIQVRFRGITGTGFASDIAIDDISVTNIALPPLAEFTADKVTVCPGNIVSFTDLSTQGATQWLWNFSPASVTYVNNTDSTSAHPQVIFNQTGTYQVSLTSSNFYGADTVIKTGFVVVSNGTLLPLTENFQSGTFPPNGWSLENPDNSTTWELISVPGSTGGGTQAVYIDNYNYNSAGSEDYLTTFAVDLTTAVTPLLTFDVAYAQFNSSFADELKILISTDCGETFNSTAYSKAGLVLATAGSQTNSWTPTGVSSWRKDSVDLTAYIGNTVVIQFVNRTGYGNNLYIDNINIEELSAVSPQASFVLPSGPFCVGAPIIFSQNSTGTSLLYNWQFPADASVQNSNTPGPVTNVFSTPGLKTITLIVSNSLGNDTISQVIQVFDLPIAAFTYTLNGVNSVSFTSGSSSWSSLAWDLGEGTTQTDTSFTHDYLANGDYPVVLIASGICGSDTFVQIVSITGITPPDAAFNASLSQICEGDTVIFTDNSTGIGISGYAWDFGADAFPSVATTAGPHPVIYSSGGQKDISLTVSNAEGNDINVFQLQVDSLPVADFSYNQAGGGFQTYVFFNESLAGDIYSWDFGDGNTSSAVHPLHTYTVNGLYDIMLITENNCGRDTLIQTLDISNVDIDDLFNDGGISLYPNPSSGIFDINFEEGWAEKVEISLWDIQGKQVFLADFRMETPVYRVNISGKSKGTYLLKVQSQDKIALKKVVIEE